MEAAPKKQPKPRKQRQKLHSNTGEDICPFCGRGLAGYTWGDGYICSATHPETGGNVAFFDWKWLDDKWTLVPREING